MRLSSIYFLFFLVYCMLYTKCRKSKITISSLGGIFKSEMPVATNDVMRWTMNNIRGYSHSIIRGYKGQRYILLVDFVIRI